VVVNQLPAAGQRTGVGHYTVQLLRCLREQPGGDQIDVYPGERVASFRDRWARISASLNPGGRHAPTPGHSVLEMLQSGARHWARRCGQALLSHHTRSVFFHRKYDLYHEPNFIPLPSDLRTVATLHDLSALLHPEWHPADRIAWYERYFPDALKRCVHFLTVSEFTRREVIRHLNVAPERVSRVYNGIRPELRPLPEADTRRVQDRLGLPRRYLLCLGTIEPRKNVLTLLRAYCALPQAVRSRWPLMLVGGWGWNTQAIADYLFHEARHRGVWYLGYVEDAYLPAVYNGARALAYPSFYEGFGLPPLEMMACGGAVLASTAEAHVETMGRQAHLIDPQDVESWRDALERVVTDDDWWESLRRGAVETARPFTWDRSAAETLWVYRSLCGVRSPHPESTQRAA
jgi:glycosyltransferase involved in cell wall biosynthesis